MAWIDSVVDGATALVRAGADRLAGQRLSVLIYHRVRRRRDELFPLGVVAEQFDRQVRSLRQAFDVLPLGEAVGRLRDRSLPRGALSITFDDGYADNAEVAVPILARHGVAATFFVSTGFLDGGRMFNDSVIECIRQAAGEQIDLEPFDLGVWSITTAAQRRQVIDLLLPKVKYLGLAQREAFLAKLMERARCARLPLDLMMRSDQVVQICRAGMEIGGHTVSHPILCSVADDVAKAEITGGRERLESLLDKRVDLFAYPNGVPSRDYDERHVAMVRALGFRAAVSTAAGVATLASDIHQLPRYTPWASTQAGWNARLLRVRMQALAGAGQA